ncbi:MAG: hypothetical protein ACUVRY_10545 [Thermoanaerobaculaceae bacterium]
MQVLTVPILEGEVGELRLTFSLAPIRHQVSRMLAWLFAGLVLHEALDRIEKAV